MGCGGSKEAGPPRKGDRGDRFIANTTIDDTGIEDFDTVFQKADDPLSSIIGMNNEFQTAIEQLMAAGSALFGANLTEATIKDGKLSIEIYKPPQEEKDKKIVIANFTGVRKPKEPKDKGIEVKDAKMYEALKKNEEFFNAMMECNEEVGLFNTFIARKELKDMKVVIDRNRARVDMPKPKDNKKELEKINLVKKSVNSVNTVFFPVKAGLAKAAFKDGLNISNVVKQLMDKLKEALKGMAPKVDVDPAGLMEGKLDFNISLPDAPDINTFIEKSDLMPPMLKKAWTHINGKGGMVDCLKECAAKLKEVKPQVDEAVEAIKGLPTEPDKIKEAAQKAVTEKKIGMTEVPKIPAKMKNNAEQLARTPEVLKEFMDNLKGTLDDLIAALGGGAQDSKGSDTGALTAALDTVQDKMETVKEETTPGKGNGEEKVEVEDKPATLDAPPAPVPAKREDTEEQQKVDEPVPPESAPKRDAPKPEQKVIEASGAVNDRMCGCVCKP